jgi:signal transduction histidine kinase
LALLETGRLGTLNDQGQRLLEFASLDTKRLVRLVNDILDLNRLKFGKTIVKPNICPTAALIQQATTIIQPIAEKAKVTLSVTNTLATVWADSDRIVQVLTNLLDNAIKFSPPGSTICLSTTQQKDLVLFKVQDSGIGIPADQLDTIFKPFAQVDTPESRASRGTGLGLAICRSIVQQHHGHLWVESTLGVGSKFYFTLPLACRKSSKKNAPHQGAIAN